MSEAFYVDKLEQLKPFLNDKKCIEIVERGKHKRIAAIQKVFLGEATKGQEKETMEKIVQALNKNTKLNEKTFKKIGQIAKTQRIGLLLNGANLCATCVGFAIMYEKLDKMSDELSLQINQLIILVKQEHDTQNELKLDEILSEHQNMLDCRRKGHPYSEEEMRKLVDQEYNLLNLLIKVFMRDISADNKSTVFSIFSLLSMFTASLRFFDEIYYCNNHAILGDESAWHSSHDKWTSVYSTLTASPFVEKLQDFASFETDFDSVSIDVYCIELLDQVIEQKEEVADNQELITMLGDLSLLQMYRDKTNEEIKDTITSAFSDVCGDTPSAETQKIFDEVMKQVALA